MLSEKLTTPSCVLWTACVSWPSSFNFLYAGCCYAAHLHPEATAADCSAGWEVPCLVCTHISSPLLPVWFIACVCIAWVNYCSNGPSTCPLTDHLSVSVCVCPFLYVHVCLFVCVCLSIFMCVCLSLSVCVCVCLFLFVCVCLSLTLCVCVFVSFCVCVCLFLSLSVYLSLSLSLCICLFLSLCVCVCVFVSFISLSVCVCLSLSLYVCFFLCMCLSLSLSPLCVCVCLFHLSLCVCVFVSFSLCLFLSVCVFVSFCVCVSLNVATLPCLLSSCFIISLLYVSSHKPMLLSLHCVACNLIVNFICHSSGRVVWDFLSAMVFLLSVLSYNILSSPSSFVIDLWIMAFCVDH